MDSLAYDTVDLWLKVDSVQVDSGLAGDVQTTVGTIKVFQSAFVILVVVLVDALYRDGKWEGGRYVLLRIPFPTTAQPVDRGTGETMVACVQHARAVRNLQELREVAEMPITISVADRGADVVRGQNAERQKSNQQGVATCKQPCIIHMLDTATKKAITQRRIDLRGVVHFALACQQPRALLLLRNLVEQYIKVRVVGKGSSQAARIRSHVL